MGFDQDFDELFVKGQARPRPTDDDSITARAMAMFLDSGKWNLDRAEVIAEGLSAAGFTTVEVTRLQERAVVMARAMR